MLALLQALTKGAVADAADAFAAMATDDASRLGAGQAAAASNDADGASDMEADSDEDDAMVKAPMNGGRRGKKRATEGFRQKVGVVGGQGRGAGVRAHP